MSEKRYRERLWARCDYCGRSESGNSRENAIDAMIEHLERFHGLDADRGAISRRLTTRPQFGVKPRDRYKAHFRPDPVPAPDAPPPARSEPMVVQLELSIGGKR